jgi:hypothetical protein
LDPPEVGILFLGEPGYISGTSVASQSRKLFVDLINRSPSGVRIRTERRIEPATLFYLSAYNKADKTWEVFEGQTRWILQERGTDAIHKVGAELKPAQAYKWFLKEEDNRDKQKPLAADYQFFRKTDLLKSISRDAVCPLLNTITFEHVTAGQRFITQGDSGDACYVIQKGTCVVSVEKDGELIPVAFYVASANQRKGFRMSSSMFLMQGVCQVIAKSVSKCCRLSPLPSFRFPQSR